MSSWSGEHLVAIVKWLVKSSHTKGFKIWIYLVVDELVVGRCVVFKTSICHQVRRIYLYLLLTRNKQMYTKCQGRPVVDLWLLEADLLADQLSKTFRQA